MRHFVEEVLSNTADVVLALSDWLFDTFGPLLEDATDNLLNFFGMLDILDWTWRLILCSLLVSVLL